MDAIGWNGAYIDGDCSCGGKGCIGGGWGEKCGGTKGWDGTGDWTREVRDEASRWSYMDVSAS